MLRRALATHGVTVVASVLALMLPGVMWAQLPDAPLPADASQLQVATVDASGNSFDSAVTMAGEQPPAYSSSVDFRSSMQPSDVSEPVPPALNFAQMSEEWAFIGESGATGQQSLYRAPKQNPAPGFSYATAGVRPIPGAGPALQSSCPKDACSVAESVMCCGMAPSPFARYLKSPDVVPLTAMDNLHSAIKNVFDPFNLLTIVADSAIGVASDSHSVYGPGMTGISKYAGVSFTEDMTGEFFGTFLIPSMLHQDPHYHREPYVSIKRRILHAITQVVWSQSYTGQPMFNYANIVGGIATAAVSNTFVPGPGRQGYGPTAQRLAIAFAISPSGNLIEEFVPDIASRINLRVVIFQRILNTVSVEESGVP